MRTFFFIFVGTSFIFASYKGYRFEKAIIGNTDEPYYYKSLLYSKENTELKAKINKLNWEVQKLKSQNHYLALKLKGTENKLDSSGREIASYTPVEKLNIGRKSKDHVQFEVYRWGEYKLYTIANREYKLKNYEKASQFYVELINQYPESQYLTEDLLLQSAFACYQTSHYYKQSVNILELLLRRYPHSKHYLKAKLWKGLSHYHMGDFKEFSASVEEFRKKYRNTKEWNILRRYYEKIIVRSQTL